MYHYHVENWKVIAERDYIWGSFLWNMFDFGAAHRMEGDRPGINDKGLVTFDRKVKKDAFYFYKANRNKDDSFVYIANRRYTERKNGNTDVLMFSTMPEVELFVNGKSLGQRKPDRYTVFLWEDLNLKKGNNVMHVRATEKDIVKMDHIMWYVY